MRFHVLATDYDGTIALHGRVDEPTLRALRRVRDSGRRILLVTGRELPELMQIFPALDIFERVVFENGAAIYDPSSKDVRVLAEPPPPAFAEALKRRGVWPLSSGRVIVATFQPHQETVFQVIQDMGLELQVIFNKDAVMVLPSGVNKATGLRAALRELGLSIHNVVAIGDAENDHAFMAQCECAVAVSNAVPSVKERAEWTTPHDHGAGVAELIDRLIADDLTSLGELVRHSIEIGTMDDGQVIRFDPAIRGLLISGTSGSGKSTLTTLLLERLADAAYQFVIIDPEGDYTNLEFASVLGSPARAPLIEEVMNALKDPVKSVVVTLLGIPLADRPAFFSQLLPKLMELRSQRGRPHWLVVDETHHLLPAKREGVEPHLALPDSGLLGITVHPGSVDRKALARFDTILAIGERPDRTLGEFCEAIGEPVPRLCPDPEKLPTGDAVVWRRGESEAVVIHTQPPRTERKRHSSKYAEGNLGANRSFYFRGPESALNLKAPNLFQFLQLADGVDDATWEFHRQNGDYSRWLREQVKDAELADIVAEVECSEASPKESRSALRSEIEKRYTLPADEASGVID